MEGWPSLISGYVPMRGNQQRVNATYCISSIPWPLGYKGFYCQIPPCHTLLCLLMENMSTWKTSQGDCTFCSHCMSRAPVTFHGAHFLRHCHCHCLFLNVFILVFQILHRNISVYFLFPDPWREGDPGFWPQNYIQSFLWGYWERMWTAHTLENCLLMWPPFLTHTSAKSSVKSDIYLYGVFFYFLWFLSCAIRSVLTTVTELYSQKAKTGLPNMHYCNLQQLSLQIFCRLYAKCGSFKTAWYFTYFWYFFWTPVPLMTKSVL